MNKFICETCGKEFVGKIPSHIYKFCSHICYIKSSNCSVGIGKAPRRKEKIFRSGYYYIHQPSHPNSGKQGYIAEHRLIMEKHIGRLLDKNEVVHHINHDITDNRIDNLRLYANRGIHTKEAHPEVIEKQKIIFKGKRFSPKTEFKKGHVPWNKVIT